MTKKLSTTGVVDGLLLHLYRIQYGLSLREKGMVGIEKGKEVDELKALQPVRDLIEVLLVGEMVGRVRRVRIHLEEAVITLLV